MLASCWTVQITTSSFLMVGESVLWPQCCRLSSNRLNTCMTSCLRGQNIGLIQASGLLHSCHDIWDKTTEKHTENLLCNAQAWNHDCVGKKAELIGLTGVYLCLLGGHVSANTHLYICPPFTSTCIYLQRLCGGTCVVDVMHGGQLRFCLTWFKEDTRWEMCSPVPTMCSSVCGCMGWV